MNLNEMQHCTMEKRQILLTSGPIGTMILGRLRRDHADASPRDAMRVSVETPEIYADIAREYADAGADIIFAATLAANGLYPWLHSLEEVRRANNRAVAVVRSVAPGRKVASMVSSPTLDDMSRHTAEMLIEQFCSLADAGADMHFLETLVAEDAARMLTECALEADVRCGTQTPLHISLTPVTGLRLLGGIPLDAAACSLLQYSPASIGINCLYPPAGIAAAVRCLAKVSPLLPLSVRPAASVPGKRVVLPAEFAKCIADCLAVDAVAIVGSCCGATPEHTSHLKTLLTESNP